MNNTLYTELEEYKYSTNRYTKKVFTLVLSVMLFGLYIGVLFYGSNSIGILSGLNDKENLLNREIRRLKITNAKLQQKIFDLNSLNPEDTQ
jgi:cell division protein FtsB